MPTAFFALHTKIQNMSDPQTLSGAHRRLLEKTRSGHDDGWIYMGLDSPK